MKTLKKILSIALLTLLLSCSSSEKIKISNELDYNKFLNNTLNISDFLIKKELDFWQNKLNNQPSQYLYLTKVANANTQLFSSKGNISYLIEAENKLLQINMKTNFSNSSNLRALARNYISQHRFKESLELLKKAAINGDNLKSTNKMLFDVYLELGDTEKASKYLSEIEDYSDFDYLIRMSKWHDHQGDLTSAIRFMEKGMKKAEESNNTALKIWSYTNLADFYGHNGQIQESYNLYLKSLALDNNNAYAKKGIAWIVFSHDRNPKEALRILDIISNEHFSPDYFLLKAEIAEYLNDSISKKNNIDIYLSIIKNSQYGVMYNQHMAKLYLEEFNDFDKAYPYIEKEIDSRPTPQSYDLLAWYYYKNKEYKKALQIVNDSVLGKSFEPSVQYHIAEIYKANNRLVAAKKIRVELLENSFELGPLMEKKILNI